MSSEREVIHRWTCDACGQVEAVGDDGSGYPMGWRQVAHALLTAKLGNSPAKHLCVECGASLNLLLGGQLGDAGDIAQAWDAGDIAQAWDAGWAAAASTEHDSPNPDREDDQR